MGTPITVPQGETRTFTVYNGDSSGTITFTLSFSGAATVVVSTFVSALVVLYQLF